MHISNDDRNSMVRLVSAVPATVEKFEVNVVNSLHGESTAANWSEVREQMTTTVRSHFPTRTARCTHGVTAGIVDHFTVQADEVC